MDDGKSWWRQEDGFSLMELSVSLPLFAVLLLSMAVLFGWGLKSYFYMVSDWQLQRDIQYSMKRISSDIMFANRVEYGSGYINISGKTDANQSTSVKYELTRERFPRIRRNSQPLTGESTLGVVEIEQMDFEMAGPSAVYIHIRGKNRITGHSYELRSAEYMLQKQGGS